VIDLRHVVIVGMNYWPEETGIAPYTTALAEHLVAVGMRVTVIAGMPYYPHWRVNEKYVGRLRVTETIRGVEVRRFRQYVPQKQSGVRRAAMELSFFIHSLVGLVWRPIQADAVLGVVPSLSGGALTALVSKRHRIPSAILFQDLVGKAVEGSGMPGAKPFIRLPRVLEGWCSRQASKVAIVSDNFRDYIKSLGVPPANIYLLPNWSHIVAPTLDRTLVRAELNWSAEHRIILHAGAISMRQGLENVVQAARLAESRYPQLRFVLLGHGSQRETLEEMSRDLSNLDFLDSQPAERFSEVLAAADVLLVNERESVENMSLPSKLTSYYVAGRPIVVAASENGATVAEAKRSGAAEIARAEDPEALLDAIQGVLSDANRYEKLSMAGPIYARENLGAEYSLGRSTEFVCSLISTASG
jgi:glycosyltransferase involved in cell wall biosynthesis